MGTAGCYGCGGVPVPTPMPYAPTVVAPAPVFAPPIMRPAPIYDADPITPGIQARPGVVTPVGPPRIVGGGAPTGIGGFGRRPGFGGFDADPITPGIQARPGVVSPVGPPRVVGGGFGGPGVGIGRPGIGIGGPGFRGGSNLGGGFYPAASTIRY